MAFDTPASNPSTRTYLEAVQDVIGGLGLTQPSDLASPSKHTSVAMTAVNQALGRIWYAAQWEWRYRFIFLSMVDKQFLYDLPTDFVEAGASVMRPQDYEQFPFIDYPILVQQFPGLAWPDETTLAAEGGTYEAEMTDVIDNDATLGGIPTHWTIVGRRMGLFPIPWLNNVDATDFGIKDRIMVGYYGALKRLTEDTDEFPIPVELYDTAHWLAQAYTKQTFEYPDAVQDEQRGERDLQVAVARQRRLGKSQPSAAGRTQW